MDLIKVTEENGNKLVSAKELHEFLESKQDFTTWIKGRIDKYGFIENEDFTLHKFMVGKSVAHNYILKMDMAKSKAISIEVGMQNSGLATSLAMMHFGAVAAIPGAIFSVWHNISGSLAANYLAGKMDKEEKAVANKLVEN